MSGKVSGKYHRKGISMVELFRRFPDDAAAGSWFVERRWPHGIACPRFGSMNVRTGAKHRTMPYRCHDQQCANTGTVTEGSKLCFQVRMIANYLLSTTEAHSWRWTSR